MATQSQVRIGWKPYVNPYVSPSTLWTSVYSVYNSETLATSLDTSIFRAYNGETVTVTSTQLAANILGVWNGETLGTSLDTSIFRVYNGDNLNDTSGNTQNGTNVGSVTFTTGKVGNAFTFNGSNYVTLPNDSMNLTGDFSISTWVNFATLSGAKDILSSFTLLGGNYYGFELYANGPGLKFSTFNGTTTYLLNDLLSGGAPLSTNTWYNIVITRKSSTGTKMYINGTLNVSNTSTQNPVYAPTNYATIGASNAGSYVNLAASGTKIDGLTIWNKELTVSEIASLYNAGNGTEYPFSSQTLPTPNDSFGTNHGTLMNGTTFTTGKIGKAFTFDGVNDYVQLQNNSLNFPSTSFSVSFWVNLANITSGNYSLVSNYANDGVNRGWIVGSLTSGKLYFGIYAPSIQETVTSATIAINTWYHVTCVYTPNQPTKTYINGTLDSTSSTSYNPSYVTTHYPSIGASKYNSSDVQQYVSNGTKIDAVNVWTKELTADEVLALYNSGNGQQYPFSSVTLSNRILDSVNAINGTNVNGVTFTTGKVGNAFTFNGINDCISLPTNSLNLTGNYSMNLWLYLPSSPNSTLLSVFGNDGTNKGFYIDLTNSNSYTFRFVGFNNGNVAIALNGGGNNGYLSRWSMATLTVSGTSVKIYLDGSLVSSGVMSSPINYIGTTYPTLGAFRIGNGSPSGYLANGTKIDGLTIWNKTLTDDEVTNLYNGGSGAEYPFSGQTLPSSNDAVGTNHGTLMNGCSFTTGKINKAFTFDGVNDYVQLPTNILKKTGDFSFSVWVNANALSGNRAIFGTYFYDGTTYGWRLDFVNSSMTFGIFGSSQVNLGLGGTFNTGQWYHIVVTRKASTGTKIYVNGTLNVSNTSTINPNYATTQYTTLGATQYQPSTTTYYFNGKIDAVNVWDKELTSTEVTELYNSGNGKQYPN